MNGIISSMGITLNYEPTLATRPLIAKILESAKATGNERLVARCLLAAKLQDMLPQSDESGNLRINDTVFYVAVSPDEALYEKCRENIEAGHCVYLLVPHRVLDETRESVEAMVPGNVEVDSLESFIAQSIDMSAFSHEGRRDELRKLFDQYNVLVEALDKSLRIEMPEGLLVGAAY